MSEKKVRPTTCAAIAARRLPLLAPRPAWTRRDVVALLRRCGRAARARWRKKKVQP